MVYQWRTSIRRFWHGMRENRHFCALCAQRADTPHPLCSACQQDMPWLGHACECCAEPISPAQTRCPRCQLHTPAFQRVLTPYRYAFPINRLIVRFKHHQQRAEGRLLAQWLAEHLKHCQDEGQPLAQQLLPVPISAQRLRQRGFNQTEWLAQWLGKSLQLPVNSHLLQRVRHSAAQQTLDAAARRSNLLDAFQLTDAHAIQGQHLALVDDVLTTGATAEVLAQLLLTQGASRVDVYCIARTPPKTTLSNLP